MNVHYLTGMSLEGCWVLVTPRRFILFVDAFSRPIAEGHMPDHFSLRDLSTASRLLQEISECGFEADHVTVSRKFRWKKFFQKTTFIPRTNVIEEFRRQKDPNELRAIRKAGRITDEILRRIPAALRSGITEQRLARKMLSWAIELGAEGFSFPVIVGFGTHTGSPHHQPTSRVLQKGHIVQIDVGVKYHGYCSDASEVFFTARPTKVQQQIYDMLSKAQSDAIRAVRPGVTTHELDNIARKVLKAAGIEASFSHSLGHGVGLEIHEGPSLSQKQPPVELLENEVVTIEPGVYFPGKFGMRVEKMVIVSS